MDEQAATEQRARFSGSAGISSSGEFEITPITAGEALGHDLFVSADVLRDSTDLLDGVECFVDHIERIGQRHSVHDLGGVCYAPVFDEALQGPRTRLKTVGPSGPLVAALGREMLQDGAPKPKIGFSADVIFTVDRDRKITRILRYISIDLVFDPARGGMFLRALNSAQSATLLKGESAMSDQPTPAPAPTAAPNADVEAVRTLLQVQQEQAKIAQEMEQARQVRAQMCAYLLDAGLGASGLPAASQTAVRKQFANRVFDATELNQAIADQRTLISELTAGDAVAGLPRAREMFDSRDQIQAAVDDLLGAQRDEEHKNLKVAKLSGIRELYHGLTGDLDFHGGYFAERARFQHTTATFPSLVKNALNKAVAEHWKEYGRAGYSWWEKIATIEHMDSLNNVTWIVTGTIGELPEVSEGAEYTELQTGDGEEVSTFKKYGGYIGITLEMIDRDDTRKVRAIPRELANAAIRKISKLTAAIFSAATYTGPTLADTGVLFNNTAVTTKGGHANLTATALGTDYTAWNALSLLVYNQPMLVRNDTGYYGAGDKQAINPSICLVNRTLEPQAQALFMPRWEAGNWVGSIPSAGGHEWGGKVEPVTVPEIASTTWWAGTVDPKLVPGVMIGERFGIRPEIYVAGDESSPAMFANDESRIKVRHFLAVGVADFRPLARGNA